MSQSRFKNFAQKECANRESDKDQISLATHSMRNDSHSHSSQTNRLLPSACALVTFFLFCSPTLALGKPSGPPQGSSPTSHACARHILSSSLSPESTASKSRQNEPVSIRRFSTIDTFDYLALASNHAELKFELGCDCRIDCPDCIDSDSSELAPQAASQDASPLVANSPANTRLPQRHTLVSQTAERLRLNVEAQPVIATPKDVILSRAPKTSPPKDLQV